MKLSSKLQGSGLTTFVVEQNSITVKIMEYETDRKHGFFVLLDRQIVDNFDNFLPALTYGVDILVQFQRLPE